MCQQTGEDVAELLEGGREQTVSVGMECKTRSSGRGRRRKRRELEELEEEA